MALKEDIILVSNLFLKQMSFEKAGDYMQGHAHRFDHPTLVAHGSVKVEVNGKETEYKAPHIIFIAKHDIHKITALEDNTVAYCVHPLRSTERVEDIIPHSMIPTGSTAHVSLVLSEEEIEKLKTHFDDDHREN